MSDPRPVLKRFHRALVEEIQKHRPDYLTGSFTVAEIYQNLVPYSSHRDRIGVKMNGDYEDALLRLLAGEGDYLILESEPALRDLRAELASPNPNAGLYREYAAVDVRLNRARLDLDVLAYEAEDRAAQAAPPRPPSLDEPASVGAAAVLPAVAPARQEDSDGRLSATAPVGARVGCQWCSADLPVRSNLNFCPFCGADLKLVPCPKCGEELEPEWRFCIACGSKAIR